MLALQCYAPPLINLHIWDASQSKNFCTLIQMLFNRRSASILLACLSAYLSACLSAYLSAYLFVARFWKQHEILWMPQKPSSK